MFLILNYRATIAQDRPARRTLCHAFIGQFEISKIPLFADDLIKIALPRSPFSSETGVLEKSCGDRLLIQRTGGSYIFTHRYLQEHFATLRNRGS
jgi:hypothetical protein